MMRTKKWMTYLLIFALVISTLYVGRPKLVSADGTYLIKVTGTDTYLYAKGGNVGAGGINNGDTGFYWILIQKNDGTYWIQNQKTGTYMAIENQTGKVELLGTIYDVWASCKWKLNVNSSTTIQSAWLGASANINVSGSDVIYNSGATMFTFENTSGGSGGGGNSGGTSGGSGTTPGTNSDINSIGASMPYTRYDSRQAILGGGASISESRNFDKNNIASQASEQSYVRLPYSGAYAEWTMATTGNGVTMRFTMPDTADGYGMQGSVDVYVNGSKVQTVNLTSYYMWQYFTAPNPSVNPTGSPYDYPISGATPAFAFDEVHFRLNTSLKVGDRIKIQSSGASGVEYGVDFLEIEEVEAKIEKPVNAYAITDFGAVANDGGSDLSAIHNCVAAAQRDGKEVYIPEGTFHIDQIWYLNASNLKISGAGIWYTNLQFTNPNSGGGGIAGSKAYNVEFCNIYLNSNLRSRYGQNAVYKCFMDVWSGNSYIHDIWEDHFECGFWFADYNFGDGTDYSDGVRVANSRIRNNFADGLNFCQGTSNATVYNCSIRNNGDDGLAMWNNNYQVKDEAYNTFCYNTIDFVWRAGGIAIYGGNGHQIYNNYIADMFMASGIHLNTAFDGYKFNNNNGITFSNNIIVRSGTTSDSWHSDMAAVDITEPNGTVRNVTFNNTYIYDSQHDAVRVTGYPSNVVFNNLQVYGTGKAGQTTYGSDNGAAIKFADLGSSPSIRLNDFKYANIAYGGIIFGSRNGCSISGEENLGSGYSYQIPLGAQNNVVEKPTEQPTEKPTEKPTEPPTVSDGYTSAGANWNNLNYWSIYFASGWAGEPTGRYKAGNSYNDFSVKITNASNAEWGVQMKTHPMNMEMGSAYKCVVTAESNMTSDRTIRFKEEITANEISKKLVAGTNTFELQFIAADTAQIFFDLGLAPEGLQFDIKSFSLEKIEVETTTQQETITVEEITTEEVTTEQSLMSDSVKILGFQFSVLRNGVRAISSVEPEINGKKVVKHGNIYGIVKDGYSADDMWIDSSNPYIKGFESTAAGISSTKFGESNTAINYVMTMINNGNTKEAYTQKYAIRAYAELSDGSYVYSNIYEYTIYDIASLLYNRTMMNTYEAHQYLYTNILTVVKPEYAIVDYNWGNTVVDPIM